MGPAVPTRRAALPQAWAVREFHMVAGGPQTAAPVRRLGVCGVRGHVGVSGRELGISGGPSPPRGSPSRHECVSQLLGARGLGSRAQRPWPQDGRECPPPVHPQPLGVSAVPGNAHSLWESPRSRERTQPLGVSAVPGRSAPELSTLSEAPASCLAGGGMLHGAGAWGLRQLHCGHASSP